MTIDDFSKQLIEKAMFQLDEKGKCNSSGAGSPCPLHGDADCNSSKQNRKEEFAAEGKNKEGKEQGADGKACWKGYKYAGTEGGEDKCVKSEETEHMEEKKDMPGNQEKIDANKNGKVDAHDFALLRAKKGKKSVKEMWEIAEAAKVGKKKVEIEIMPDIDTPNDTEPPTGKKAKLKKEEVELEEKKLSAAEKTKKEKVVKGMKKKFGKMKSKYGDKAQSVMYGAATNIAKKA